jgi:hypothetical protein
MAWQSALPLTVSPSERAILEAVTGSEQIPERVRKRARVVLMAARGVANHQIAVDAGLARARVLYWRQRFQQGGIRGLWDREGYLPAEPIPEAVERDIVEECLYRPRLSGAACIEQMLVDPSINWNVRNLARRHGISPASVQRIWKKYGVRMQRYRHIDRGVDLRTHPRVPL